MKWCTLVFFISLSAHAVQLTITKNGVVESYSLNDNRGNYFVAERFPAEKGSFVTRCAYFYQGGRGLHGKSMDDDLFYVLKEKIDQNDLKAIKFFFKRLKEL